MGLFTNFRNSAAKAEKSAPVVETALQLFDAVRDDDLAKMKAALDSGIPVDATNEFGETALMLAVNRHHAALAQELLARKANPIFVGQDNNTPLCYAAQAGHWDMVRLLASSGARPSSKNPAEFLVLNALLLRGIAEENAEQVTALEAAGVDDAETLKNKVLKIIEANDRAQLEACLQAGVPATLRDNRGNTLFMNALLSGAGSLLEPLETFGADLKATNPAGDSAMSIAEKKSDYAAVAFLRAHGIQSATPVTPVERQQALRAAVESGNASAVQSLLQAGATPDDQRQGKTLLEIATEKKYSGIVATLINAGAHPADAGVPGVFHIGVAVIQSRNVDAVKKYLDSKALDKNTGPQAFDKFNLVHVAAEQGAEIAKLVATAYPNLVNRKEKWGSSPLRVALEKDNLSAVQALLDAGADPRVSGKSPQSEDITDAEFADKHCSRAVAEAVKHAGGKFELLEAASNGDVDALENALNQGLSPNITDGNGKSLLYHAITRRHADIVQTLLKHGANASAECEAGLPMSAAVAFGNPDIIRMLGDAGAGVFTPDKRGYIPASALDTPSTPPEVKEAINYCKDLEVVRMAQDATRLDAKMSVGKTLKFKMRPAATA